MTVEYADAQASTPFWTRTARATIDKLAIELDTTVLDIGCATGDSTRHMAAAAGAAIGIDSDASLVAEATRRTGPEYDARFEHASADALPFPDASFAAIRTDRALHRTEDLGAAIREIWRVAAPGATIVALEPDWDTLVIDAGPLAATRAVCRACSDRASNPAAGRQIARRLRTLGATDVQVEPLTAALTDLAAAEHQYGLTQLAGSSLPGAAARSWLKTLKERDEQGTFLAALTYFLTSARRPA
jgi:ubiquinone/menaquinone biosynthesis C-methylase UbiE